MLSGSVPYTTFSTYFLQQFMKDCWFITTFFNNVYWCEGKEINKSHSELNYKLKKVLVSTRKI